MNCSLWGHKAAGMHVRVERVHPVILKDPQVVARARDRDAYFRAHSAGCALGRVAPAGDDGPGRHRVDRLAVVEPVAQYRGVAGAGLELRPAAVAFAADDVDVLAQGLDADLVDEGGEALAHLQAVAAHR